MQMICRRSNTYGENVVMTDETPNERLYTNGRQKCRCRIVAVYVRMSKIVFYENPYIVTGDIKHTGSKGSLRVCTDRNIGTWKGRNMEWIAPL